MLYTETVEAGTLDLIQRLMRDEKLVEFNLVGGTALSLKLGHRKSIDIDLFTGRDFDAPGLSNHLQKNYRADIHRTIKNGVFGFINDVKLDLIAHQYPLVKQIEVNNGIRMFSLEDIAAMKLNAILYNGTRMKDFVDIYALLEHLPLEILTDAFVKKYPDVNRDMAQKALLYHNDVHLKEKISYLGHAPKWAEIETRLKMAVVNPSVIFNFSMRKQPQKLTSPRHRRNRPKL